MFLQSEENRFLFKILRPRKIGYHLRDLRSEFPKIFDEAVHRSQETLEMAESEWELFADEFYRNRGLLVPDWPNYVEIQEGLGIYGRSPFERKLRKLKRRIQRQLNLLLYRICRLVTLSV
jgi:hypothetical protein